MSEPTAKPNALIPEWALLAPLPEHHKKRFETALYLMHDNLTEGLTWEQIAEQSAISPFHFHRQFTQLFHETPGRYLSRVRLQYAVYMLFRNDDLKITEIALQCGYSSSQALAKSLKRELGLTAKAVTQLIASGTPKQVAELLEKLAHPCPEGSLEKKMAESLSYELVWYPKRGVKTQDIPNFDWDLVFEHQGEKSTQLLCATPITDLERPWREMGYSVGNWQTPIAECDFHIAEGYYLCCEVHIVSDLAYMTTIEALFNAAEKSGHHIDEKGFFIEMVRDVELTLTGGATFAFQIPIQD